MYANFPYDNALTYIHACAVMICLKFLGIILDINAGALMIRLQFVGRILYDNARAVIHRLKFVGRIVDNSQYTKILSSKWHRK